MWKETKEMKSQQEIIEWERKEMALLGVVKDKVEHGMLNKIYALMRV